MTISGTSIFSGRAFEVELKGASVVEARPIPASPGLPFLAPGFIDLQVNGYRGMDYSSPAFSIDEAARMVEVLAVSGTTKHLPTIITAPEDLIIDNLKKLRRARSGDVRVAAAIPGYHIEGPYISPEDGARGAHSLSWVRKPDYDEYRRWQEAADGLIRIVTLAPELPGALEFIERVSADGVIAAIGHTAAAPETIHDAVLAGASMSTHLGNGSHAFIPRLKNYIWQQLAEDRLEAGIITDGYHLPQGVIKTFARTKGAERLVLVSDVAVHGGADPGIYTWGDNEVEVFSDGHLGIRGTDFLAGAGHLLDHDLGVFISATGTTLSEAIRLCTLSPARLIGLALEEDFTRAGSPADFVLFAYSEEEARLEVHETILSGCRIYEHAGGAPRAGLD